MELFEDCRENSYAIDPDFEQCQAVYSSDSEYSCEVVIIIKFMGITQYVLCCKVDQISVFHFPCFLARTFEKIIVASNLHLLTTWKTFKAWMTVRLHARTSQIVRSFSMTGHPKFVK